MRLASSHGESAWVRARRDANAALRSVRFVIAVVIADGVATAAAVIASQKHSAQVQALFAGAATITGTVALAVIVLLAAFVLAPVRQRDEARTELGRIAQRTGAIMAQFSWQENYLQIGITNDGPSLKSALMNVLVPATAERIWRLGENGTPARTGSQLATDENLIPGTPSIYWQEANIQVPGFGTSTLFYFIVGRVASGQIPVKFKIGGDELGRWLEFAGQVTRPPPPTAHTEVTQPQ